MSRAPSRRPVLPLAASAVVATAALLLATAAPDAAHAQSTPLPLRPPAAVYVAGDGPGEFRSPEGVFMYDRSGRIVVADTGNHRIQVFHPNGTFAYAIGGPEPGDGPGEFRSPVGVHTGRYNEILVADTGNHRIQVFHPNGTFAFQFGTNGDGPGELSYPASVTYDWVYREFMVADTGNDRIQVFRTNGSFAAQFALHDIPRGVLDTGQNYSRYGNLSGPTGAMHLDGFPIVAVADTGNDRIVIFLHDPIANFRPISLVDFQPTLGSHGTGDWEFDGPRSIDVQHGLNIIVADTGNHRVQALNIGNPPIHYFSLGSNGTGPGEFLSPAAASQATGGAIGGAFAVADTGNHRIQVFHQNRTLNFILGLPGNGTDGGGGGTPTDGGGGGTPTDGGGGGTPTDGGGGGTPTDGGGGGTPTDGGGGGTPTNGGGGGTPTDGGGGGTPTNGGGGGTPTNGGGGGTPTNGGGGGTPTNGGGGGTPTNGGGGGTPTNGGGGGTPTNGGGGGTPTNGGGGGTPTNGGGGGTPTNGGGGGTPTNGGGGGTPTNGGGGGTPTDGDTCSISLASASLDVRAAPGAASPSAVQVLTNTGSLDLAGVVVSVTPWYIDPVGAPPYGAGHAALPATLTELSTAGSAVPRSFAALSADGTAPLAPGLPPGDSSSLWFRINLGGLTGLMGGGELVQYATYLVECVAPPPPA